VHLLAEERGATLEVIVSRMKAVNPEIRFVAVSATVPNIEDVAVWLGPGRASNRPVSREADGASLPPMARVMKFGDEFRPVPLQK
jgi:ATP-dependent DNA helicase HFM1/MER3